MNETEVKNLPFAAAFREPNVGDPNWYVEIPNINGCFSSGKTLAEAEENIKIALVNHSLDKPLTLHEVMHMDCMEYVWNSGYQGYTFRFLVAEVTALLINKEPAVAEF